MGMEWWYVLGECICIKKVPVLTGTFFVFVICNNYAFVLPV